MLLDVVEEGGEGEGAVVAEVEAEEQVVLVVEGGLLQFVLEEFGGFVAVQRRRRGFAGGGLLLETAEAVQVGLGVGCLADLGCAG